MSDSMKIEWSANEFTEKKLLYHLGEAVRSYYNLMNKSGECVCLTAEEAFEKVTDVLQHENLTSNRGNDK